MISSFFPKFLSKNNFYVFFLRSKKVRKKSKSKRKRNNRSSKSLRGNLFTFFLFTFDHRFPLDASLEKRKTFILSDNKKALALSNNSRCSVKALRLPLLNNSKKKKKLVCLFKVAKSFFLAFGRTNV